MENLTTIFSPDTNKLLSFGLDLDSNLSSGPYKIVILAMVPPAATGIYFFGIYWDFLINPHTFWNKSHRISEVGA
jgi:hypothetical protein